MYAWPVDEQTVRIRLMTEPKRPLCPPPEFLCHLGFDVDSSNRGIVKADIGYIRISHPVVSP